MKVLICAGSKTQKITQSIKAKYSQKGVDFIEVNKIEDIPSIYPRGEYFDRAIIVDSGWTDDSNDSSEMSWRTKIDSFAEDCTRHARPGMSIVFMARSKEMAAIAYEETLRVRYYSLVVFAEPPYTVKFFTSLVATSFDAFPSEIIYTDETDEHAEEPETNDAESYAEDDYNSHVSFGIEDYNDPSINGQDANVDEGYEVPFEYGGNAGEPTEFDDMGAGEDDGYNSEGYPVDDYNTSEPEASLDDSEMGYSEEYDHNGYKIDQSDYGTEPDGYDANDEYGAEADYGADHDYGDPEYDEQPDYNGEAYHTEGYEQRGFGPDDYEPEQPDENDYGSGSYSNEDYSDSGYEKEYYESDSYNSPSYSSGQDDYISHRGYEEQEEEEQVQRVDMSDKQIKAALQAFASKGNSIVVTGCGGCGTSTVAYNLANTLCNLGYTVLLVDMDTMGRTQSYISKDNYDSMEPDGSNLMAAVNSSVGINAHISIVRQGFHLLSMGIGGDIASVDKLLHKQKLLRFATTAKNDHNFVIYDIPFDDATDFASEILYMCDNLVFVIDASNWGATKSMMRVCNISSDETQEIFFHRAQVVFNRVRGCNKFFGKKVKNLKMVLREMDNKIVDLIGDEPDFYFKNMHYAGEIMEDPEFETGWYSRKQFSDTKKGQPIFIELVKRILLKL